MPGDARGFDTLPDGGRTARPIVTLSNSLGVGGVNALLVFAREAADADLDSGRTR